ncbi:MAG: ABC transporter ATP-binding protein [Fimbriimonadaceae bacterium]|nr:ABC transporter ATP-binding protein [Fimbriimonadaceae bacterium]
MPYAVSMQGMTKRFGAVEALNEVTLNVASGSIHAVVGENGAGKTTLMRILYGALAADEGLLKVNENEVHFKNAAQGIATGIGMVSQHYSIIPELTCLQNLMLGAEPGPLISLKPAQERAQSLAERMGFTFEWDALAETLSPAQAQKLEILKLLWRNAKIMILDEPTAMLSPQDSAQLYASLKRLASEGATVIVVTHRIPEVLEHCDDVTVLRGGKLITSKPVSETDCPELAELIVGHAMSAPPERAERQGGSLILVIDRLTVKGHRGEDAVKELSLEVRKGEVVGIAGVDGSGQRELFWALMGILRPTSGLISLDEITLNDKTTAERIALGLRLIPEDRHEEGVVDSWPLTENAMLGLQEIPPFSDGRWIRTEPKHQAANEIAAMFDTRHGGLNSPMQSLSGGNQQRFVAARVLWLNPKLILGFQPARGLDIDATRRLYDSIRAKCQEGAVALIVSYDLDELLENCDRLVAMNRGRLHNPPAGQERDRATVGQLMVGE